VELVHIGLSGKGKYYPTVKCQGTDMTEWPKSGLIMFQIQFICTFVVSIFITDHSRDILHNLCICSEQLQCEQISRLFFLSHHVFVHRCT
jgi:hypothetical protein